MKRLVKALTVVALVVVLSLVSAAVIVYATLCTGHPHGMC